MVFSRSYLIYGIAVLLIQKSDLRQSPGFPIAFFYLSGINRRNMNSSGAACRYIDIHDELFTFFLPFNGCPAIGCLVQPVRRVIVPFLPVLHRGLACHRQRYFRWTSRLCGLPGVSPRVAISKQSVLQHLSPWMRWKNGRCRWGSYRI